MSPLLAALLGGALIGVSASALLLLNGRVAGVTWGGPPARSSIDGTVVPCAAIGSLMFAPEICLPVVHEMKSRFGEKIYGRYGFADAFHAGNGWVAPEVLAIDVGITLLAIENFRSGHVWRWFMANPEPQRALELAELRMER